MTQLATYFELQNIYKRFDRNMVLRGIDFSLQPGEAVALLGANGAGKSTLLRIMATLTRPTRGVVSAFGTEAWSSRVEVRRRIGVVAHQPWIYPELTCRENLDFFCRMFGLVNPARPSQVLEQVGLIPQTDQRARSLSRGQLQRLNLARAILHEPFVLILDEPDTGLDGTGRELLAAIVRSHVDRGGAAVLTSHQHEFARTFATRVDEIVGGTLVTG